MYTAADKIFCNSKNPFYMIEQFEVSPTLDVNENVDYQNALYILDTALLRCQDFIYPYPMGVFAGEPLWVEEYMNDGAFFLNEYYCNYATSVNASSRITTHLPDGSLDITEIGHRWGEIDEKGEPYNRVFFRRSLVEIVEADGLLIPRIRISNPREAQIREAAERINAWGVVGQFAEYM